MLGREAVAQSPCGFLDLLFRPVSWFSARLTRVIASKVILMERENCEKFHTILLRVTIDILWTIVCDRQGKVHLAIC